MATIKTLEDYPIKQEYYYVVDFRNYYRLRVYPVYFVNKKAAKRALDLSVKKLRLRRHYYQVVSGKKLVGLKIPYIFKKKFWSRKYEYPKDRQTKLERKAYRTKLRRRLRRMGLLTLIKVKYSVEQGKRPQTRIKKNTQRVAMSPNTVARVFRLERKPDKYYYFIIKKEKTHVKGVLLKIRALRLDIKAGELKKVWVNIYSKDVIIPYILTEIPQKIKQHDHYQKILKKLRRKGFDCFHKTPEEKVL